MAEDFVGEAIKPRAGTFDPGGMVRGEPGLPQRFVWRDTEYTLAAVLEVWKEDGPCRHGSGEQYLRKHWFKILTAQGPRMTIFFERQARSKRQNKARWWLYTITGSRRPAEGNSIRAQAAPWRNSSIHHRDPLACSSREGRPVTNQTHQEHDMTKHLKPGIKSSENPSLLWGIVWVGILLTPGALARANWPGFRGPTGLGYTTQENLPLTWGGPAGENVLWTAPLTGQGHASPIVWDQALIVCTVKWPAEVEDPKKVIPEHHVTCYRTSDGGLLWDTLVPPGPWLRNDFRSGPGGGYAAATPVTDGRLIYGAFASSVLAAVDFQGKIAWRRSIVPYSFDVTLGSSPVLYGDTVILFCAMAKKEDSCVVAFDKTSGAVRWERKFPQMRFGHSTPLIIQVNNKPQMLLLASGMEEAGDALQSLAPADGKLLWWCRGEGDASSPAYGQGLVYFDDGRGGTGVAVDPTGSGDVSATHVRWTITQRGEALSSPIIVGPYLYRLRTPGFLQCWDTATGKEMYSQRLEGISSTWASPIADPQGRLFFANAGKSYVVQAGPECRILAVNDLGDGNHPSPAAAHGRLFLVGMKNLYCLGTKNTGAPK